MRVNILNSRYNRQMIFPKTSTTVLQLAERIPLAIHTVAPFPGFRNADYILLHRLVVTCIDEDLERCHNIGRGRNHRYRPFQTSDDPGFYHLRTSSRTSALMIAPLFYRWLRVVVYKESLTAFAKRLGCSVYRLRTWTEHATAYPPLDYRKRLWQLWEQSGTYAIQVSEKQARDLKEFF